MKAIPAIWTCLLGVAPGLLLVGCAKGTGSDFGAFGNTVAMGEDVGTSAGADGDGGDDKPEDDGPASGPVDGGGGDDPDPDGGADGSGDCCVGHGGMGCADAGVAACVCAQDPFCCDNAWDGACVDLVNDLGCGMCGVGDDGGATDGAGDGMGDSGGAVGDTGGPPPPPPGNVGDCCAANNSVGCDDAAVQMCVCAVDSYCCDTDWDSICVGLVDSESCGNCGGGGGGSTGGGGGGTTGAGGTTSGGGGGSTGDCCAANGTPGCDDPTVEACVCAADAFCCNTEWDSICADLVDSEMCGDCGGGGGGSTGGGGGGSTSGGGTSGGGGMASPCCVAAGTPGCPADPAVETCVCAADPFCCDVQWDQICADAVEGEMCGSC